MKNIQLLVRTLSHLRPQQIIYQLLNRVYKAKYEQYLSPTLQPLNLQVAPIPKFRSVEIKTFTFLNLEHIFAGWNFIENGMLWAYNQNYFDWINQEGISEEEGCKWIDKFIEELPTNKVGLDPYPIALRSINWVKFFCRNPESATKDRLDSLYSQLRLLEKKLEYHLLGNHLLEDAYTLYIGGAFFGDERLLKKTKKLLLRQLKEQILPDGAHYEQSVMYHCILLDRLLDCINIGESFAANEIQLREYAKRMLGHLESVAWSDGSIPMVNDAAEGIAPAVRDIFDYARRLDLKWEAIPMKECGYRKLKDEHMEAIVDVGNITATYQPGHTHADTFNYELRIDGKPFIVDTGTSTYNKNAQRQYERSTPAHNTVCVNDKNSSEVWDGFRVGKQANVTLIKDSSSVIRAFHNGYGNNIHTRSFLIKRDCFSIKDEFKGLAINYIHFDPEIVVKEWDKTKIVTDVAIIELKNIINIELIKAEVSKEYNRCLKTHVAKITFDRMMEYNISCL